MVQVLHAPHPELGGLLLGLLGEHLQGIENQININKLMTALSQVCYYQCIELCHVASIAPR